MQQSLKVIAVVLLVTVSSFAQSLGSGPTEPIQTFLDGFNKGDMAAAASAQAADSVIMDEVPPHIWRGAGALKAWLTSLDAYDKAHGRTDGAVSMGKPQVTTTAGDRAYAVVPAVYAFKEKGRSMRETATMTFALHRYGTVWKIDGWSWNGTVPAVTK